MPFAVWPILMALSAVLCLLSAATSQHKAARSLAAVFCAYVLIRLSHMAFPGHDIALAIGAFIWASVAAVVCRIGNSTSGGIIVLSALCYFWAKAIGSPVSIGSVPFVLSDLLMAFAMVRIGWHGISIITSRALDLVLSGGGNGLHMGSGIDCQRAQAARWEKR